MVVIEDAAQAIGAGRNGQAIGSCGQATCFSFYPTKNLSELLEMAAIITNDDAVFTELTTLRNYGQKERYIHTHLGFEQPPGRAPCSALAPGVAAAAAGVDKAPT